jgi:hypothetical protein
MGAGTETTLGDSFARALAGKDFDRILELLHPEVDFLAMTPRRSWTASGPQDLVANVFGQWFEPSDEIDEIVAVETDAFADRHRVGYRFAGHNPDGPFVVEQQAYYAERDGQIGWLRIMCSGFRPR